VCFFESGLFGDVEDHGLDGLKAIVDVKLFFDGGEAEVSVLKDEDPIFEDDAIYFFLPINFVRDVISKPSLH
jgi:hypothetical protein